MSDSRYIKTIEQLKDQLSSKDNIIRDLRKERNDLKRANVSLKNEIDDLRDDLQAFDTGNIIQRLREQRQIQRERANALEQVIQILSETSKDSWNDSQNDYEVLLKFMEESLAGNGADYNPALMYDSFLNTFHREVLGYQIGQQKIESIALSTESLNLSILDIQTNFRLAGIFQAGINFLHYIRAVSGAPEVLLSYIMSDLRNSEDCRFDYAHLSQLGINWFTKNYPDSPKKLKTVEEWLIISERTIRFNGSYDEVAKSGISSKDVIPDFATSS